MPASRRLKRRAKKRPLIGNPHRRFKGPSVLDKLIAERKQIIEHIRAQKAHVSVVGDAVSQSSCIAIMWAQLMQIDHRLRNEFHVEPDGLASRRGKDTDLLPRLGDTVPSPMGVRSPDLQDIREPIPELSGWHTLYGGA